MNDLLVELFRHNTWANIKMIEFCRDLPPEQRDSDLKVEGTYGAIKDTLVHMIASQQSYLHTYGRSAEPPSDKFESWDVLLDQARKSSEGYEAWTAETPVGEVLDADFGPTTWSAPTWLIITQLINHSTEHRGHVGTVLAHLGIQSPPCDLWAYGTEVGKVTTRPKA
ncbi:MAG TPA: DinB family protein [Dehalococcoidia bacterium]|nr:DinB family protein [Dehalococcoidia bacterium]